MSNNHQKFESSMFEYCSNQVERAYKLFEDGDTENGMQYLAHSADILQMLVEARNSHGSTSIGDFANAVMELPELEREEVFTFFQSCGFGQYIPE